MSKQSQMIRSRMGCSTQRGGLKLAIEQLPSQSFPHRWLICRSNTTSTIHISPIFGRIPPQSPNAVRQSQRFSLRRRVSQPPLKKKQRRLIQQSEFVQANRELL